MEYLPTEVLEVIFLNLDGISLSRASLVSTRWMEIIEYLNRVPDLWYRICIKEIECHTLHEVKCQLFPIRSCALTWNNWRSIYISWYRNCKMHTMSVKATKVVRSTSMKLLVTCIKASGKIVITGHNNGFMYFWYLYPTAKKFESTWLCNTRIMDIALLANLDPDSSVRNDRIVGIVHDYVLSTSASHWLVLTVPLENGIKSTFGQSLAWMPKLPNIIRTNGVDMGAVLSVSGFYTCHIQVFHVQPDPESSLPRVHVLHTLIQNTENGGKLLSLSMTFSNQISTLDNRGVVRVWDCVSGQPVETIPSTTTFQNVVWGPNVVKLCRRDIAIWLSPPPPLLEAQNDNILPGTHLKLYIKVGGQGCSEHYPMQHLSGVPSVFLLNGPLFVIGTSVGGVYVYLIKCEADLLTLNLDQFMWRHTNPSKQPIISLDIINSTTALGVVTASKLDVDYISLLPVNGPNAPTD